MLHVYYIFIVLEACASVEIARPIIGIVNNLPRIIRTHGIPSSAMNWIP